MDEFKAGALPKWAAGVSEAPAFPDIRFANAKFEKELREGWKGALSSSGRPIAVPVAVTALAHAKEEIKEKRESGRRGPAGLTAAEPRRVTTSPENLDESTDLSGERDARQLTSRFGPEFGATVHAALSTILRGSPTEIKSVVSACAAKNGLENHIDEAIKDVQRTLDALKKMGLLAENVARYPEYPVVMPDGQGRLITGYIDLVANDPDCIWIIDFKTDPPPTGPIKAAYPIYMKQIDLYKELLSNTVQLDKPIRAGLLFSATGRLES
jgi:ATP-dependent exoDNAse (exonuclease V) beta subunit